MRGSAERWRDFARISLTLHPGYDCCGHYFEGKRLGGLRRLHLVQPCQGQADRGGPAIGGAAPGQALVQAPGAAGVPRRHLALRHPASVADDRAGARAVPLPDRAGVARSRGVEGTTLLHRALAIRDRLAAAEPANAQWQIDLVMLLVGLAQAGDDAPARLARALEIVRRLAAEGKLTPDQKSWPQAIEQAIAALP